MLLLDVLIAAGIYALVMGVNIFVLARRFSWSYLVAPYKITVYFVIASSILALLFPSIVISSLSVIEPIGFMLLGLLVAVLFIFYQVIKSLPSISFLKEKYPRIDVLYIDGNYIFSKSFEILFQQLVILILVSTFAAIFDGVLLVSLVFAIVFGLLHIPLIIDFGKQFGRLFLFGALISGAVFPPLMLLSSHGVVLSYMVHWLFYICIVLVLRSRYLRGRLYSI